MDDWREVVVGVAKFGKEAGDAVKPKINPFRVKCREAVKHLAERRRVRHLCSFSATASRSLAGFFGVGKGFWLATGAAE